MKKIILLITFLFFGQVTKAQDTCATAINISAGIYTIGVINGQVPAPVCASNGAIPTANIPAGEWYVYTPTQNYTVTVTSDIAANTPRKDTRFHVYTGNCSSLTCYAGDDDSGTSLSSVSVFNVIAGTTYYIAWDNRWLNTTSNTGFSFQLIEGQYVVPPPTPIVFSTQTIPTINSTYNLCVVDMDGDKKDDIVGVSSNNLRIHYQGATSGSFTTTDFPITGATFMPGWSMAAGDYNKDGFNDLVLGSGNGLSILKSNNTGSAYTGITPGEYIFCQRTNFADLNKDGNLDIFSCHDVAPNVYYLNDGNANLTYYQSNTTAGAMNLSTGGGNYATLFTDFDNDGDTDVFISKCSGPPCQLFRYDGGNTYTNVSTIAGIDITPIQTWSSAIADFDNDGDMDIIITASSGTHKAYDFDNDGFVDVLGGGGKIMFNQRNGTFAPVTYSGIAVGAVGDLNNDGFLDIQSGSTIRYAVPNGNNWLKVALNGIQSNSNGIGARIEIYGAWGKQIRDIRSGEGFKYMSSLNAHFGIGTATTINQVIIRWPSGIIDTYNNVTPNQRLNVVEGATLGTNSLENNVFTMYPNPVKNIINISINTANPVELINAEIYDLTGRRVQANLGKNQSINVDFLSTGTYILKLTDSNNKNYCQKFIKE
ncbi:MAG: T9SS C-terminal target domain-containing protein [Flavobacteriaceae bacterium]|nr:T9SS C-terminal target domain-containing protein [Flavobacteriaceae bacterium]